MIGRRGRPSLAPVIDRRPGSAGERSGEPSGQEFARQAARIPDHRSPATRRSNHAARPDGRIAEQHDAIKAPVRDRNSNSCAAPSSAQPPQRLSRIRAGDVVLRLKSAYKDGTTHVVMSLLAFMRRVAALVPRPRLHRIFTHGVLVPASNQCGQPACGESIRLLRKSAFPLVQSFSAPSGSMSPSESIDCSAYRTYSPTQEKGAVDFPIRGSVVRDANSKKTLTVTQPINIK